MTIDRGNGVAIWRQIYESLRMDILHGRIAQGAMLPTESQLAERFSVNRHTVRRAVQVLGENGFVITKQGSGTFVPETVVDYAIKKRTRFSETITAQSRLPNKRLIESTFVKADDHQARLLGLRKSARLIRARVIGEADGVALSLSDHFYSAQRFPKIDELIAETSSVTKAFASFGIHDYERKKTLVTTNLPTREEADLLNQPPQRPVLVTENVNVSFDGEVIEYSRTLFAGDRVQLVFEPGA